MSGQNRLLIVSNRLPITLEHTSDGFAVRPSSGGLVSALLPVFKARGGAWIGWPGTDREGAIENLLSRECTPDYMFEPVFLSASETIHFYDGCCNQIIWPLFHDLQSRCNFNPTYWIVYRDTNEKFADAVERIARRDDFIWIHDYHLMMLADCLRARGMRTRLAYFHHVPFPAPDVFEKLPWRKEILRALMHFNSVGFQTDRDRRNFLACLRRCLGDVKIRRNRGKFLVAAAGRHTEIATLPIGIDFDALAGAAVKLEVSLEMEEIKRSLSGKQLIVGVDRLDFTKGIPQRLLAFRTLLQSRPELQGMITLIQLVVPSREGVAMYRECRNEVERLVSDINGEFGHPGWIPVSYLHRHVSLNELLGLYRAADVALVTPIKDGMNLVAKEFCAARNDQQGVLVLSEFAGAAAELDSGALLVNPYDAEGVASAIYQALLMTEEEQRARMQKMRAVVQRNNVFKWCKSICGHFASEKVAQLVAPLSQSRSIAQAV